MTIVETLLIGDIMKFDYCPRIIYFEKVLKNPQKKTPKTWKGLRVHDEFSIKAKRAKLIHELPPLEKAFMVRLSSEKYNLRTMVDCIVFDGNNAYPVEFKFSKSPNGFLYRTQKHQLAAQAMLIEENMCKSVPFGYIKFIRDKKLVKTPITNKMKEEVQKILITIERIIRNEHMPEPTPYKKRCAKCCFWKDCKGV
jgi:CRISPR-associated protein Cas4